MKRLLTILVGLIAASLSDPALADWRVTTSSVNPSNPAKIWVSVTDENGKSVTGLNKSAFDIQVVSCFTQECRTISSTISEVLEDISAPNQHGVYRITFTPAQGRSIGYVIVRTYRVTVDASTLGGPVKMNREQTAQLLVR